MQNFDDNVGKRRLLNIRKMSFSDVKEYCSQFFSLDKTVRIQMGKELKAEIQEMNNLANGWVLAVESKDGKVFGKFEIKEISPEKALVSIEIPNKTLVYKYGTEAIDQLVKICKEKKYFSTIKLDDSNIAERYRRMHSLPGLEMHIA